MAALIRCAQKELLGQYCLRNGMSTSAKAAAGMESFWKKNERLQRPISPHLSIYKPQLSSALSIANRGTAAVLTGAMYAMPLLYVCGSKDYSAYLDIVKSWGVVGTGLIWTTKTGLAFCFSYHLCGGIRHLVWDLAVGLDKEMVNTSGIILLAMAVLLTAVFVLFM